MSDLFHEEIPFEYVRKVFHKMETYDAHIYQVLTKRPERMLEFVEWDKQTERWPDHVWAGTSVENQYWADRRIPILQQIPANVRFLSVEPLLKSVDLSPYLSSLQWVIVGGESGYRARPMNEQWAQRIRDDCVDVGVPFFFKQWGGRTSKSGGRELDGREWDEMPKEVTTVQEPVGARPKS